MAETIAALATRLGTRLGFTRTTTTETSRLQAAVASAVHQALVEGAPGIERDVFSGATWGTLAVTVTHSAGATTGTVTPVLSGKNVLPGDFLRAVNGEDYTLFSVAESTDTLGFGAPVQASLSGAGTIYRRGIVLTSGGSVSRVTAEEERALVARDGAAHMKPHETGVPELFEQRWDSVGERSVLLLYPAPSSAERMLITQAKDLGVLSSGTSIPWRPTALEAVLDAALRKWLTWSGGQNQVEAQLVDQAARMGEAGLQSSSTGGPIING